MTHRFNALEINDAPTAAKPAAPASRGEQIKDAQFFLDAANTHFYRLEWEPALKSCSQAASIDAGSAQAWLGQIFCLVNLQEYREAELWYGKAIDIVGEGADLLAVRAILAARCADFERACGFSDSSLESAGTSALPFIARGEIFLYARRNAEYCFEQACSCQPQDWRPRVLIAESCLFNGKDAAVMLGMKFVQSMLATQGQQAELHLALGRLCLALGRNAEAHQALEEASVLAPDMTSVAQYLAQSRARRGFFARLFGAKK